MNNGFLIDTDVLSELIRESPAPQVLDWFAGQTANQMKTSAITYAEILAGIALLPAGKRREAMARAASRIFEEDFFWTMHRLWWAGSRALRPGQAQRQLAGRP